MSATTKHSAILIGALAITSILNYVLGVAMSWFLTPAEFGVLGVAQSLLLLLALVAGSGFAWTAAHDLAGSGVTGRTRQRFRVAWLANVVLGLTLGSGLWLAYALGWLPLGPAYRAVVPLVALTTLLLAARSVVNGAVRGLYRFGPLALNQVGEVAIKAGAGMALVVAGAGVPGVMGGFALGTAAALVHSLWVTRQERLWQGVGRIDGRTARRVVAATIPLFVGMLGTALMLNLDILGLKLLTPTVQSDKAVGFYQAAVILARMPVFVAQSLILVLFTYIAGGERREEGRPTPTPPIGRGIGFQPSTSKHLGDALRAWLRLLLPAGLVLVLAPEAALSLFFPNQYQAAAPALRLAAAGGMLLALVTLLIAVLQAAGERRRPALVTALAASVQVTILIWLVPTWGALGAAASLLAAGTVALAGLVPMLWPHMGPLWAKEPRPHLSRMLPPLLALALPLLLLPDGGRGAALLKLGLAGLGYLLVLAGVHAGPTRGTNRPAKRLFAQFVQILMGG